MTKLSERDSALLDLAREADMPSEADRARVRAALASRLGTAAGLAVVAGIGTATHAASASAGAFGTGATAATAGTAGGTAMGVLGAGTAAAKLAAVVAVSLTVAVGASVAHHERRAKVGLAAVSGRASQRAQHRLAEATPPPPTVAPPAVRPPPETVRPSPEEPANSPASGTPVERRTQVSGLAPPVHGHVKAAPRQQPWPNGDTRVAPEPARPAGSVADEAALVHAGLLARRSGQPERALELLDRHALLYPQGVLTEERDAERALALADLGRTREARAAIGQFLCAHPLSALGVRLRERQRLLGATAGQGP